VPARQADHKRESAHQYEAEGPSRIQIKPAPRHELETQVPVDQPGQDAAGCDHRDRVDDGDQDRHAEMGFDEGACRLVAAVEIGGAAETKIDRYATAKDQSPSGVGRIRASTRGWLRLMSRKLPNPMTRRLAPIWICRCHWTRATSREKGRITTSIASRWPTVSGPSVATRARELLSISPAETASGHPIPGFTP